VQVPASVDAALREHPAGMAPQIHPQQNAAQQMNQAHAAQVAQAHAAQAQMATMNRIVMSLQQYEQAGPFLEPVPREVEGYHAMISHPMDLGTITAKLHRGMYPSVQHVHQDIMLMIQNCYTFNTEGSEIYNCAQQLELMYRRLCTEGGLM
jgi:Bromodomain